MSQAKRGFMYVICYFVLFTTTSAVADERESLIHKKGQLDVCIWPDYFSVSYYNNRSNQLEGIDIDLSKAFADDLNVNVNYVTSHFGRFMDDLENDKCDIAMFGIAATDSRKKRVDFSNTYLSSGMYAVIVKKHPFIKSWENIDQTGVIVAVQKGTYMENAMRKQLKNASLKITTEPNQRELEVQSGRADAFVTDFPYGQKMITLFDWAKLISLGESTEPLHYAYAIKKGQPAWLEKVNEFVAEIKEDGRLKTYAEKNKLTPIAIFQ
jgi:ABC-type amino acid transport substrate-binding protein